MVSVVAYLRQRLNDRGANCGVPLLALEFSVNQRCPLTDLVVNVVGLGSAQKLKMFCDHFTRLMSEEPPPLKKG